MKPLRVSPLPYILLGAMTIVSFGGPFLILLVVRGGSSPTWPPDRPVEWITSCVVLGLFIALFLSCVTIRLWYQELRPTREAHKR